MKLTIRRKLIAGFATIFVLMILIFGLSVFRLWELNGRLNRLVDVSAKTMMLADHINNYVMLEIIRAKNNVLLSRSPAEMERYAARMDELQKEYYERMENLYHLSTNETRVHLNESKALIDEYLDNCHQVVNLARAGKLEEARNLSVENGRPTMDRAHAIMTSIVERYDKALQVEKLASNRNYIAAVSFLSICLAIAVVTGILTAAAIIRGIVNRVQKMSQKAGEIASGKLSESNGEIDGDHDELSPAFLALGDISKSFANITRQAKQITGGDLTVSIEPRSKEDELALTLQEMTRSLREARERTEKDTWFKSGQNGLNEQIRGDREMQNLAGNIVSYLANYLGAQIGSLYVADEESDDLRLFGAYACDNGIDLKLNPVCRIGEGLAGQAAKERTVLSLRNIPEDYIRVNSTLGDSLPRHIVVSPISLNGTVKGVVELGSLEEFSPSQLEFVESISESAAIAINSAQVRARLRALLEETQRQAAELQAQQVELTQVNEELQRQTVELKASEERLKDQQTELEAVNAELEENSAQLRNQQVEILKKNTELESARQDIEQKARELEIKSKYKSEFLSNMSHELRTPLNTLLILAQNLNENKYANLNADQLESAQLIYKSGVDLLDLINEILDLAKVEAGKMTLTPTKVRLSELAENIEIMSKPSAEEKGLKLQVALEQGVPPEITTDHKRLSQIIKNLVSNAVKFTETGGITIRIHRPGTGTDLSRSGLEPEKAFGISVIDTGIGIPAEKQMEIFEAFQQVDGSISRKYGGTGLGLSITRELTKLLGGEIRIQSQPGKGSTFTVFLPLEMSDRPVEPTVIHPRQSSPKPQIPEGIRLAGHEAGADSEFLPDDREKIAENTRAILVIEDDPNFAKVLMNQCHEHGFKCLLSRTGEDGLNLAERFRPAAVILDIHLPGISGWQVLDALKQNVGVRHIPVHIISVEEITVDAFKKGAMGFISKPVTQQDVDQAFESIENVLQKKVKDLLLVEDDEVQQRVIAQTIGNSDVKVTGVRSGREALDALRTRKFECMVLDLGLPDMSGFQLLSELDKDKDAVIPPTIVYTGKELTREEEADLQRYAESIIVKGVKSQERLLDETALFLHRVIDDLPEKKQQIISDLYNKDDLFAGKKVLLVDDDMRNVFVLSKILKEKGLDVLKAENGKAALELLEKEHVDAILMDIMMPVMDGYEAIEKIRADERYRGIPIIAQTAKAMREDREKVMAAGANDYIEKPLNIDRLMSMLRVWLYR